jgi:hypothetical protein
MKRYSELQTMMLEKGELCCSDIEELLGDFTAGELPDTLCQRFVAHVKGCSKCQELKSGYELTISLAKELRPEPPSKEVQNRLRAGLERRLGIVLSRVE